MLKSLNKKGSIVDIGFLLVVLLGLGIFIMVVAKVFPMITSAIGDTPIGDNVNSAAALNATDSIAGRGDGVFLIIFIGLTIAIFITSFFIDSSPILIPIYIIAVGLLIIFAVVAENIYESFISEPTFTGIVHPMTNYIMSHLVLIAIGVGVISMILIFAKRGGGSSPY